MSVTLVGGWGYNNLGDDAILAGYVSYLSERVDFEVLSADVTRTQRVHRNAFNVRGEGDRTKSNDLLLVAGGGYLNGSWVPEIYRKSFRLRQQRTQSERALAHGIEVRKLQKPVISKNLQVLLHSASVAVRDSESQENILRLTGADSIVLPDAIALLSRSVFDYVRPISTVKGKILVNLLDIGRRGDSDEAEFSCEEWTAYAESLVRQLGDRAIGLIVGDGDYSYMRTFPGLPLVAPKTVSDLVSLIEGADALLTVRMHPGLIASTLNKPVVSIPYCGKVRPTLRRLNVEDQVLSSLDLDVTLDMLDDPVDRVPMWIRAFDETDSWLSKRLAR